MSLERVKRAHQRELLSFPGVVGLGIGHGCLNLYVTSPYDSHPSQVEDVPIVRQSIQPPHIFPVQYPTSYYQDIRRPYSGGVSIGSMGLLGQVAGTLGMVVPDRDGSPLLLSNNHVMAGLDTLESGGADPSAGVSQPGFSGDVVAVLKRWVPISLGSVNQVDCAVAAPITPSDAARGLLGLGDPAFVGDALQGMIVGKVGMTSGFTAGRVIDVNATLRISYGQYVATYDDQVIVDNSGFSFAQPGDSGSVAVVKSFDRLVAVGLIIGGSESVVVMNRLSLVQKALGFAMPYYRLVESPSPLSYTVAVSLLAPALL